MNDSSAEFWRSLATEIDVAAMKTIPVSEFKAKCIGLLKDVHKTKEPILVTLRGVPVVRIEPVVKPAKRVRLGALKGWMKIKGDIIKSDFDDDFLVR
ncbi:MAG: prevent-host-death family protein [Verrucomicrobia bacterium]|nr:MAG: prevent-host-death family protein [Verrucomicrobiota bacterium]